MSVHTTLSSICDMKRGVYILPQHLSRHPSGAAPQLVHQTFQIAVALALPPSPSASEFEQHSAVWKGIQRVHFHIRWCTCQLPQPFPTKFVVQQFIRLRYILRCALPWYVQVIWTQPAELPRQCRWWEHLSRLQCCGLKSYPRQLTWLCKRLPCVGLCYTVCNSASPSFQLPCAM